MGDGVFFPDSGVPAQPPITKGRISVTLTIWCGLCGEWEHLEDSKKRQAGIKARQAGWRLTRQYGWLCPSHNKT